jgi:signal transduction histidine kinase
MELNRTRRWFYGLTLLWVVMLLGLGSWWLYLVFKLHQTMTSLSIPELGSQERFLNMMRWEGSFFFIFLSALGVSLLLMYMRDMKKTKAMQVFFASLSHELKTPLASMRLQAEVIKDLVEDESHSHDQLSDLTKRLIQDTHKLESELEKSLQLSRIEQDGTLCLVPINIERFLKHTFTRYNSAVEVVIDVDADAKEIMADELALKVIIRNLFENTLRHQPESKKIEMKALRDSNRVIVTYDDFGKKFEGSGTNLGTLFYKFNSTKGSGVGLYLIKNLMRKMDGTLSIQNHERLRFELSFVTPTGDHHV